MARLHHLELCNLTFLIAKQPIVLQGSELHVAPESVDVCAQFVFCGKILEHDVHRSVIQSSELVGVPVRIVVRDWRTVTLDKQVVQ